MFTTPHKVVFTALIATCCRVCRLAARNLELGMKRSISIPLGHRVELIALTDTCCRVCRLPAVEC